MANAFTPGSFYDNLDAAVRMLGLQQPGVTWALAGVSWDSVEDRDNFLRTVQAKNYFDITGKGGA